MMRPSTIQFAPSQRRQDSTPCNRRTVYLSSRAVRQQAVAATFATSARNVRVTWKVILLLWIALMAALCLRANSADLPARSLSSHAVEGHQNLTGITGNDSAE
jgi:hypothetical protein